MLSIIEIVTEMASYVKRSGFSVEYNSSMGWVAIHNKEVEEDTFFLQDADAEQFADEAQRMAVTADVDIDVALLAQAKQYVDCI
jgi:hypothetical protein